jgi:anti-sigma factor RsiW
MKTKMCDLLDKYRDGELSASEQSVFESHLSGCEDCRMAMALLNNIVHLIKTEEAVPLDRANQIARNAFQHAKSWDFEVISWLRPAPALATLALMIALFSSLWIISGNRQVTSYSEYEKLMEEADAVTVRSSLSQFRNTDLVTWLEQEGNSQ